MAYFFSVQVSLISLKRANIHKKLGIFGACLAIAVFVSGITVAIKAHLHFNPAHPESIGFMTIPIMSVTMFAVWTACGIVFRKFPTIHKRLMLIALIELLVAPLARIFLPLLAPILGFGVISIYPPAYVLLIFAMGYDLLTRGKIHRIYWVAVPVMIAGHFLVSIVYIHPYWATIAHAIFGR